MRTVRALLACLVALACLWPTACTRKPLPRLKIAATIFPIYDLTRTIAGPDADVLLLVPPGRPENDFVPSEEDAARLAGVRLGIRVGLGLDDWLQPALDAVAPASRRLAVGDRVPTLVYKPNVVAKVAGHNNPDLDPRLEGTTDPHVWLDPQRAELIVKAIAEEMARADVAHAAAYRSRGAALEKSLEALDREIEVRMIRWWTHELVTFRPAFAYFAERYHLDVVATLEAYPGRIPNLHYDQEVARVVRTKGLGGVFREPQFAPRPAFIVAEATRVPVGVLDALGGEPPVDSYEKLIRFDVDALEQVMKAAPKPVPEGGAETQGDAPSD